MEALPTIGKLNVQARSTSGKGQARKVRAAGKIPCVLYGGGKEALSLIADPVELQKSLDPAKRRNTLIDLTIENDDGSTVNEKVMLKDYQIDVLKQDLLHADFIRVGVDETIRVKVPLELEGKSAGVKLGGTLHKVFRQLEIECTPDKIPSQITGDISDLNIGDALTIGQLAVPEGVSICLPEQQTCAQVLAPRAVEEEAGEGEEGVEGEAAEGAGEAAEGAAPAKEGDGGAAK